MRVAFDFTVDDVADTAVRAMRRSKSVQAIRSREVWTTTIVSSIALFITWNVSAGGFRLEGLYRGYLAMSLVVSIAIGVMIFYGYRAFYDRTVRRRVRRLAVEQFAKSSSHRCEIEVRSDGLWARQDNVEITHGWADRESVIDTGDALEVHFRNGIVVVRNRAFDSLEQRAEFASRCRA